MKEGYNEELEALLEKFIILQEKENLDFHIKFDPLWEEYEKIWKPAREKFDREKRPIVEAHRKNKARLDRQFIEERQELMKRYKPWNINLRPSRPRSKDRLIRIGRYASLRSQEEGITVEGQLFWLSISGRANDILEGLQKGRTEWK